ncbi:hypothetical protein ABGN35_000248 [Yersinia enterocolitica]
MLNPNEAIGSLGFSDLDNQASFKTSTSSMGLSSGGFTGNQGVRPSQLADFNKPTLINDVVQAKIDKRPDKNYPNGNMGTAHAEVGVIQQAFDKGMTQGREMAMSVAGKEVCNYCLSDVRAMAEKAGLKSLTVYEEATGNVLFWQQGMNKIENRGPAK